MFIQTEDTPNPNTLKFIPGVDVLGEAGTYHFSTKEEGERSLLAKNLFAINAVCEVFFGSDFISVTKASDVDWSTLKIQILSTIMDYFVRHKTVEIAESKDASSSDRAALSDVEKEIQELLDARIRPAVAQDGGDITFERFEDGVVYLKMKGACSGCPSSTATLKSGIENMLRYYIPEVQEVRAAA